MSKNDMESEYIINIPENNTAYDSDLVTPYIIVDLDNLWIM